MRKYNPVCSMEIKMEDLEANIGIMQKLWMALIDKNHGVAFSAVKGKEDTYELTVLEILKGE